MWRKTYLLLALVPVACSPLRGCVESNFVLDDNSRLPVWFTLPPGIARANTGVELTLWTNGDAEFEFIDHNAHRTIDRKIGPTCWHPETHYKHNSDGTYSSPGGPEYNYMTISGKTDVVEFTERANIIRMTDDSKLLEEASAAAAHHECRREP